MKHLWEQCWVNHIPPSPKPLQTARKQCDESSRDEIREGNNYLQTCSSWEAPPSCRNSLGQGEQEEDRCPIGTVLSGV